MCGRVLLISQDVFLHFSEFPDESTDQCYSTFRVGGSAGAEGETVLFGWNQHRL